MTTKPYQQPPGSQPGDPPGWRLAFAIWESVRTDDWTPMFKLALLIVLILAGLTRATAMLGSWSLIACLAGASGTAAIRARHRRQHPTRPRR